MRGSTQSAANVRASLLTSGYCSEGGYYHAATPRRGEKVDEVGQEAWL
jgi:hypothetical protein